VRSLRGSAAKDAGLPLRVGLAPARRAIKLLDSDLAIHSPIAPINFENFALEILFLEVGAFPKKFPHGLTGERKAIDMSLKIIERSLGTIHLGFGAVRNSLCACDSRLLINFPKHGICRIRLRPRLRQPAQKRKPTTTATPNSFAEGAPSM